MTPAPSQGAGFPGTETNALPQGGTDAGTVKRFKPLGRDRETGPRRPAVLSPQFPGAR